MFCSEIKSATSWVEVNMNVLLCGRAVLNGQESVNS